MLWTHHVHESIIDQHQPDRSANQVLYAVLECLDWVDDDAVMNIINVRM